MSSPLKAVAKGGALIAVGTILGTLFKFAANWLLANHLSAADFGAWGFAVSSLTILAGLSTVGTVYLMLKFLPHYLVSGEKENAVALLNHAFKVTLFVSVLAGVVFSVFFSGYLSDHFLKSAAFAPVLSWLFLATPVLSLLLLFVAAFQGFSRAGEKILTYDLVMNGLLLVSVGLLVYLGALSLASAVFVQWISLAVAFIGSALLLNRLVRDLRVPSFVDASQNAKNHWLAFAWPLLIQDVFGLLVLWTDTFVLGLNLGASAMGAYFAASRLATALSLFLTAASYLYAPLAAGFFAQNRLADIRRLYRSLTKWVTLVTLPVFMVFILFPNVVLTFFYGDKFSEATAALSILSLGYLAFTMTGPNGVTLLSLGRNKYLLASTVAAGVSNLLLSLFLVPRFGITGAAFSAMGALFVLNGLISLELYRGYSISPFSKKTLACFLCSLAAGGVVYVGSKSLYPTTPVFLVPVLTAVYLVIYAVLARTTGALDADDLALLSSVAGRFKAFGGLKG